MGVIARHIEQRSAGSYHPKDPALAELFGFRATASGQHVTPDTAMRTSAVYACVTVLAQTLAMLPKHIKEVRPDGSKQKRPGHRLSKLLRSRPNPWQSSFGFFQMMEGHRQMRGNAYARYIFIPGQPRHELVPMHPDSVFPFVITPSGATYYLYDTSPCPPAGSVLWYQHFPQNGPSEILSADEVLHVRGFTINGIIGLSPIKWAAYQAVGLAMATEEHGARLFSNGAQIAKVFKHPLKLKEETYKRLKEQLNTGGEYAGAGNAHKTMILEDGMDIAKIAMTGVESQFLESRKFQVEDIARIFNVPLILIGHGDKAPTYASAEQFFMSFKVHTIAPNVSCWEGDMDRTLLYPSEEGKIEIDFDMDSMLRGDAAARAAYLKARFEMASITPDGVCLYEGENPTGTEEGKQLYLQSGMLPARLAGQKPLPSKEGKK